MKKIKILAIILTLSLFYVSCTKGPGTGGRASIVGHVYAMNYSNSFAKIDSGYLGGYNVYIKYGDEQGISDNTDTDPDGTFKFDFLREGKYSIIVYSKVLFNGALDSAVVLPVEITSRKEELSLSDIHINTLKN